MDKIIFAHRIAFFATLAISVILMVVSFFMPPKGVIDPSVLKAAGYLFGWGALVQLPIVIQDAKHTKITSGKTTIEIDKKD